MNNSTFEATYFQDRGLARFFISQTEYRLTAEYFLNEITSNYLS